jgi:hypothetical protein
VTTVDGNAGQSTWQMRMLSTTRPHVLYWVAAAEILLFCILGAVVMTQTVGGGLALCGAGFFAALFPFSAARWSEHHPDLAQQQVATQRARRNRLAQKHPAYFMVFVPIIVGLDASLRWNRNEHHHSLAGWLIPAGIGVLLGLVIGAIVVHHARRARAQFDSRA